MHDIRRVLGVGVAVVVAAMTVTACTQDSPSQQPQATTTTSPPPAIASETPRTLDPDEQRSVLVSLADQPATRLALGPMTLKQAAAERAFETPPSMVFEPRSCSTFLEDAVGSLDELDGWVQYGTRNHDDHNDPFIQVVARIPGGANMDRIRESAASCRTGTLTLEDRVTGEITYTERRATLLPDATTFSVTGMTQFREEPGSEEAAIVARFELPPHASPLLGADLQCIANINVTAMGENLIVVMESDAALADELTGSMHRTAHDLAT